MNPSQMPVGAFTRDPEPQQTTPELTEWSGHPCPLDPDNFWIDDATGERIPAKDKLMESDE